MGVPPSRKGITLPMLAGSSITAAITRATFPRDVGASVEDSPAPMRPTVIAPVGSSCVSRPGPRIVQSRSVVCRLFVFEGVVGGAYRLV